MTEYDVFRGELFGFRRFLLYGGIEMRERPAIKIRVEVVWSWFGCKERRGCLRVVGMITEEEQWLSMKRRL